LLTSFCNDKQAYIDSVIAEWLRPVR